MEYNTTEVAVGLLKGFKKDWNPFIREAYMQVDVKGKIFNLPIDRRQIRFVEKEYQVGSMVELHYDGVWHINSRTLTMNEPVTVDRDRSVYL
jgi:hypothetical protein